MVKTQAKAKKQGSNWTPAYHRTDPDLAQVLLLLKNLADKESVADRAGVTIQTLNNWISGRVKRPYNVTLSSVMSVLGYRRRWEKGSD